MTTSTKFDLPFSRAAIIVCAMLSSIRKKKRELTLSANGYFNAYGNAARKNKHDYVASLLYTHPLSPQPPPLT